MIDLLHILANAAPQCGPGKLESLIYVGTSPNDGIIVIKLDSLKIPNYTKRLNMAKDLFDAFLDEKSVVIYTNTCQTEDYGFAELDVLND